MSGKSVDAAPVAACSTPERLPVYLHRGAVPRDYRTADELRGGGYLVHGDAVALFRSVAGTIALYSTTEARRLRGDMWLRPRGTPGGVGEGSAAARRATASGRAETRRVRSYTPTQPGRYKRPSLPREPRRWLQELFREGFVVIDVETTGLSARDEVVEVAAVDFEGAVLFESLVRPRLGRMPSAAVRVHGIGWSQVEDAPSWPEVVHSLADSLAGHRVLAWNASFDERLVAQTSRGWSLEHPLPGFECAMRAYATCRGVGTGGMRLSRAAAVEGVMAGSQSHRSAADAALTVAVLRAIHANQARAA